MPEGKQDGQGTTEETRDEGLAILRSWQPSQVKCRELEALLGIPDFWTASWGQIAGQLGISYPRFQWYMWGRERQREERIATREVATRPGSVVTSEKLGFTIWLPDGYHVLVDKVDDDPSEVGDIERESNLRYRWWRRYQSAQCSPAEKEAKEKYWRERLASAHDLGWSTGSWFASPVQPGDKELDPVCVFRYRFRAPLTSLAFYYAAKPDPTTLLEGNRPMKHYVIDGLEAIRYYCRSLHSECQDLQIYMADEFTGWLITATTSPRPATTCRQSRALFLRIASSFHRQ